MRPMAKAKLFFMDTWKYQFLRPEIFPTWKVISIIVGMYYLTSSNLLGWVSKLVDKGDVTDSYVDVHLGKARLVRTRVIDNDLNPKFNEDYRVEVCHFANELTFDIKDKKTTWKQIEP